MSSSVEPGHGGPVAPWETLEENADGDLDVETVEEQYAPEVVEAGLVRGEIEVEDGIIRPSRRTRTKCETAVTEPETAKEELAEWVADRFREMYPKRAGLPLTTTDGQTLRRRYAYVEREDWVGEKARPGDPTERPPSGETVTDVSSVSWADAVRRLVEDHERAKETTVNLAHGDRDSPDARLSIDAKTRWMKEYQERYFGQIQGWLRELTGGERPTGETVEASFENPSVALVTRSASSVPDRDQLDRSYLEAKKRLTSRMDRLGVEYEYSQRYEHPEKKDRRDVMFDAGFHPDRLGWVEHAEQIRSSWRPVYQHLTYKMDQLGFDKDEWQYIRVAEPHKVERGDGRGTNAAYWHEHIVLVVDGEISAADLRSVAERHVDRTPAAGREAHDLDVEDWSSNAEDVETVEVRNPNDLEDVGAYVADYASVNPVDLTERSTEYQAFAAGATALNARTLTRSDAARDAADADRCKTAHDTGSQESGHGEAVRRRNGRVECVECGSSHGIDQSQSLTSHRLAADGGEVDRVGGLKERWQDADAAVVYGQHKDVARVESRVSRYFENNPNADVTDAMGQLVGREGLDVERWVVEAVHDRPEWFNAEVPVGFDSDIEAGWWVESVEVGDEEFTPSGGGVEMVEVTNTEERLRDGLQPEMGTLYRCECGVGVRGPEVASHLRTHGVEDLDMAEKLVTVVESGDSHSGLDSGPETWLCDRDAHESVVVTLAGHECPLCGRGEPS